MKRVKVCHLSSVHSAGDVRIFHKQCRALSNAGYEVCFVVPHDKDGIQDGIRLRAVSKPRNRIERMTRTLWAVYRSAVHEAAAVYHFHDPELIPVGVLLKLHGKKVIFDVHEDLPKQIMTKDWIPPIARHVIAGVARVANRFACAMFDLIIPATPAIARNFAATKTAVVQNFPILGELQAPAQIEYSKRPPQIAYIGGITAIRGAREMVEAMGHLPVGVDASLVIAGAFDSDALELTLRELPGWQRVQFLGWQSRQQVRELLAQSRVGIVAFHPVPNHTEAQPNKLFEYMSAGIPVIASDFPLWREIIEGAGAGMLVDPMDCVALSAAIQWILSHSDEAQAMGRRGCEAVQGRYNWERESHQLLRAYARLLEGESPTVPAKSTVRS